MVDWSCSIVIMTVFDKDQKKIASSARKHFTNVRLKMET